MLRLRTINLCLALALCSNVASAEEAEIRVPADMPVGIVTVALTLPPEAIERIDRPLKRLVLAAPQGKDGRRDTAREMRFVARVLRRLGSSQEVRDWQVQLGNTRARYQPLFSPKQHISVTQQLGGAGPTATTLQRTFDGASSQLPVLSAFAQTPAGASVKWGRDVQTSRAALRQALRRPSPLRRR